MNFSSRRPAVACAAMRIRMQRDNLSLPCSLALRFRPSDDILASIKRKNKRTKRLTDNIESPWFLASQSKLVFACRKGHTRISIVSAPFSRLPRIATCPSIRSFRVGQRPRSQPQIHFSIAEVELVLTRNRGAPLTMRNNEIGLSVRRFVTCRFCTINK